MPPFPSFTCTRNNCLQRPKELRHRKICCLATFIFIIVYVCVCGVCVCVWCVCVRACMRACVRACVHACVRACVVNHYLQLLFGFYVVLTVFLFSVNRNCTHDVVHFQVIAKAFQHCLHVVLVHGTCITHAEFIGCWVVLKYKVYPMFVSCRVEVYSRNTSG